MGVVHGKTEMNVGSLWRSAQALGAAFIFTVGRRYKPQASDTGKSWRHIPLINFQSLDYMKSVLPRECLLVGVEILDKATPLEKFSHPRSACYLLGAEDHGLTKKALDMCHEVVRIGQDVNINVACAGTVVMYDRLAKQSQIKALCHK